MPRYLKSHGHVHCKNTPYVMMQQLHSQGKALLHHGSYHQHNAPCSRCLLSVPLSCVGFSYRCCIRILIGTSSIPSKAFILQITVKLIASLKLHLRHGEVQPLRSVLLSPQMSGEESIA